MVLVTIRYTRNGGTKDSDVYWGDLTVYFGEDFKRLVQWAKPTLLFLCAARLTLPCLN